MPIILILAIFLLLIFAFQRELPLREERLRRRRRWFWSLLGLTVFIGLVHAQEGPFVSREDDWIISFIVLPGLVLALLLYSWWQHIGAFIRRDPLVDVAWLPPEVQQDIAPYTGGRRYLLRFELEEAQNEACFHHRQAIWSLKAAEKREAAEQAAHLAELERNLKRALPPQTQVLIERRVREDASLGAQALRRENEELKARLRRAGEP